MSKKDVPPQVPEPSWLDSSLGYTADQMRAYGEACARAALAQAEAAQPVAESPARREGRLLAEVDQEQGPLLVAARNAIATTLHEDSCTPTHMRVPVNEWLSLQGEVMHALREEARKAFAAAPQPAEAAPTADLASENAELRHLLAVRVAGALLYADDGELSDASELPAIDFKRDTPGEIARKLTDRGLKWLTRPTKAARVHALVNAGAYPGMSEAFDAHMGAACWTDPAYRPDAATWAAAWKAALSAAEAAPKQEAAK